MRYVGSSNSVAVHGFTQYYLQLLYPSYRTIRKPIIIRSRTLEPNGPYDLPSIPAFSSRARQPSRIGTILHESPNYRRRVNEPTESPRRPVREWVWAAAVITGQQVRRKRIGWISNTQPDASSRTPTHCRRTVLTATCFLDAMTTLKICIRNNR